MSVATKNPPMSSVEAIIKAKVGEARKLLQNLEAVLVRCGYTRDCHYNSMSRVFSDRRGRSTFIEWSEGRILLYRVKGKGDDRKVDKIKVEEMTEGELVCIALNLPSFIDTLEDHSRHLLKQIEDCCVTVRKLTDCVEQDPQTAVIV